MMGVIRRLTWVQKQQTKTAEQLANERRERELRERIRQMRTSKT